MNKKKEVDMLREALAHIIGTVRNSRTSTRRLRWIEQRAEWALQGKPYDDSQFDLPKETTDTAEKLKQKVAQLEKTNEELRLNACRWVVLHTLVQAGDGLQLEVNGKGWDAFIKFIDAEVQQAIETIKEEKG